MRALTINSNGKAIMKSIARMRKNLEYHGIARRAINDSHIKYDGEIDVSAVLMK